MADNASQNATTEFLEFYNTARIVTGLTVYPIVCLFGLVGNTLILSVLTKKSFASSTDIYLGALALSDMAKLLNDFLYFVTCLLMETNPSAGNKAYAFLYPYAHFVFNASVCVSSWLTVSVSVERYILVCHPTKSKTMTSVARSKAISLAVIVGMSLVALPSALRYRTVEVVRQSRDDRTMMVTGGSNVTSLDVELTALFKNETFSRAYNWLQSLLRSIIPLGILIITSCFITNALWKTRANKKMASRNRITLMLTIVVLFFIVCILPDAVMSALYLGYTESDSFLVRGIREITDTLLAVNAAVNFLLYVLFNRRFKTSFERQFCAACIRSSATVNSDPTAVGTPSAIQSGGLYQRLLEVRKEAAAMVAIGSMKKVTLASEVKESVV